MELSERKKDVLSAISRAYISTGEPVGSKTLTELMHNAPSSATLRNEMSELSEMGLLSQPHTSAGRIPTDRGLKLYVEELMRSSELSVSARERIDRELRNITAAPELIPQKAGELVYRLTGLPVFTCFYTEKVPRVLRAEIMPIGKNAATLLLLSGDGRARHRIVRLHTPLTADGLQRFRTVVRERIRGRPVSELDRAALQTVIASSGMELLAEAPLLAAVFELAGEIETSGAELHGVSALYSVCGSETAARRITELVRLHEPIISLVHKAPGASGVIFGSETDFPEFSGMSIVLAKYNGSDRYQGAIGVIGPHRMPYDRVIAGLEYVASRMTESITEAQKDMEE